MSEKHEESSKRQDHYFNLLKQEVYTPQEAAEVLNIGERVILSAAYGGDLKSTIINGDVVEMTRTDLVAWLQKRDRL